MTSLLKSTKNTRLILPNNYKYVRSDVPSNLTDEEIQWLIQNKITTIVDLRESKERQQKQCCLQNYPIFNYICLPVTGGNTIPSSVEKVSSSYINMVDENMNLIIDTILNSKTNVLYFCNAGKDRTGVVSAILLHQFNKDRNFIIEDYMQSKENLKNMIEIYTKQNPNINKEIITPQKRYMEEFLDYLEGAYHNEKH